MARLVKPLTATQVNNAKQKATMYKMFDGGGLFLQVPVRRQILENEIP